MAKKLSPSKFLVVLCWLAYTTLYIGRKNYSACMAGMINTGLFDKVFGGMIGTGFLICYAAGQLVNGFLGDKISPARMIPTGLFLAGAMNVLMGVNSIPALHLIIWCVCGFSCSMLWSPIVRAMSTWAEESVALAAGASLSVTIPVGSILSYLICAAMLKIAGWRAAFMVCGAILIVASIAVSAGFLALKPHIAAMESARANAADTAAKRPDARDLIALCLSVGLAYTAGGILLNGILKDGLDLWVPTYLADVHVSSEHAASLICGALPIAGIAGVYMAKWLDSRRFRNEMTTAAVMFAASAAVLLPVCIITKLGAVNIAGTVVCIVAIAISSAAMLGANSMFLTFIPFRFAAIGRASTVTGVLNALSYLAAAISGITVGLIATAGGWVATFVTFASVSAGGALICFIGASPWQKGRNKLEK